MDKNSRLLILLFSLILVVIPVVIFPDRLGLPLAGGSAVNMLYELVFYGFVYFLFRRETTLAALMVSSALTLVYRMALGAAFGLVIITMYGLGSSVSFSLGMTKYLPGVLLHVIVAPFIIRPFYLSLAEQMTPAGKEKTSRSEPASKPVIYLDNVSTRPRTYPAADEIAVGGGKPTDRREKAVPSGSAAGAGAQAPACTTDENQFERAVTYLGESNAVRMALLVDEEGLPLARYGRSGDDVEMWAPLAIMLRQTCRDLMERFEHEESAERIDLSTRKIRVILRRIEHVNLMVLADKDIDETIHIRIAQATDMVRKYMSERYSPAMFARAEERYVSNS
jgi:predicted regulator of Ras-like GTPase activity (Roadblock/LC7/MglB family)